MKKKLTPAQLEIFFAEKVLKISSGVKRKKRGVKDSKKTTCKNGEQRGTVKQRYRKNKGFMALERNKIT